MDARDCFPPLSTPEANQSMCCTENTNAQWKRETEKAYGFRQRYRTYSTKGWEMFESRNFQGFGRVIFASNKKNHEYLEQTEEKAKGDKSDISSILRTRKSLSLTLFCRRLPPAHFHTKLLTHEKK